jgi:ADP-ribose pyrophosphatase YjhB (NUDIX family)
MDGFRRRKGDRVSAGEQIRMPKRHSHCSFCGAAFAADLGWPRTCGSCAQTTYLNPLPVAILLLPVDGGLLTVRRGIEPRKGMLALPGGYIGLGESWQQAAARELWEETGVRVDPDGVRDFRVLSAPDGTVLIFGVAEPVREEDLPPFAPCMETAERVVLKAPEELAFPLHSRVVEEFFNRR